MARISGNEPQSLMTGQNNSLVQIEEKYCRYGPDKRAQCELETWMPRIVNDTASIRFMVIVIETTGTARVAARLDMFVSREIVSGSEF